MPDKLMTTRLCESKSACGPEREIKVFAEQDDINLEYCDREDADKDWCVFAVQSLFCMQKNRRFGLITTSCLLDRHSALLFDGRPVRHVRLDARVAVIDEIKRKQQTLAKTVSVKNYQKEEAPWFL